MRSRIYVVFLVLLSIVFAGCAANSERPSASADKAAITVKGQIAYRERIALPPGSHAQVTVMDTAVADRKAPVVASQRIDLANRQIPAAFQFDIQRDNLVPRGRYSLRATISGPDDQLLWTTDTAHRVDTDKRVNDFGLLMLKRAEADAQADSDANSPLTGAEWVVENIADAGIIDSSRVTLNFDADGRLYGRASCNRYSGAYEINGDRLSVGQTAATLMACAPALNNQERRFLDVLQDARSFDIDDTGKLIIRAASGETLEAYAEQ
jgi:putative lipoprotein